MATYHIVYEPWQGARVQTNVRAKSLIAALQIVGSSLVKYIVSADIVEKRTRATRMRKWDARDLAEELRGRDGWRREGMANERAEGAALDQTFRNLPPLLTPVNIGSFLRGMLAKANTPKSADSARRASVQND